MTGGVLHVPYTYFPDPAGGTEVYVHALSRALAGGGIVSSVAAPGTESAAYVHDGVPVRRFATDRSRRLDLAYGAPDEVAAAGFRAIVAERRPSLVHLHARTAAVSERLIDAAREVGAKVLFTYHTPTVTCLRGTMMRDGLTACDGRIERTGCIACALASHGVPSPLASLGARMPGALATMAPLMGSAIGGGTRGSRALRTPALLASAIDRIRAFLAGTDHIVAVSRWVYEVLERNGIAPSRITLCRQGLAHPPQLRAPTTRATGRDGLRLAYFGRIDHTKGVDLLVDAVGMIPNAAVTLDIVGVPPDRSDAEVDRLRGVAASDRRIRLRAPLPAADVPDAMAGYDLIAIPSRWLETGPLVALEAFAAGVPVMGADHGGIAELVRDGVDGVLLKPNDAAAWATAIERLASTPDSPAALRRGVRPPRTMQTVTDEMAALYGRLLDARQHSDVLQIPGERAPL